jgi:hypothetical protein
MREEVRDHARHCADLLRRQKETMAELARVLSGGRIRDWVTA